MTEAKVKLPGDKPPTYHQVIQEILATVNKPIPTEDMVARIQAIRPSQAKNPLRAIRNKIREEEGRQLVIAEDNVIPLWLAMQGVRYRLPLDREQVDSGLLPLTPNFSAYLPRNFQITSIQFIDHTGQSIPFLIREVQEPIESLFGPQTFTVSYFDLKKWLRSQKAYHKDHILVTIMDWDHGIFHLEREPASIRDDGVIAKRDRLLVDLLYEALEKTQDETLYEYSAIPKTYAMLPDRGGCPPHHWLTVIQNDGRMIFDGWRIHYSDSGFSPLEMMIREMQPEKPQPAKKLTKQQQRLVYRFKAALNLNKRLWRRIEIKGYQTLGELDMIMREAFQYDQFDHLGGFWKLVARSGRKRVRYREVDLGHIQPLGGGQEANIRIADLDLSTGGKLKYVYDFGDWIEHELTLEALEAPQEGAKYPRIFGQNKPRYINCTSCQETDKQTVANWVCITCSNHTGKDFVLCEECFDQHEDHYIEKLLY